ncbi:MAG: patatin-like phospholipase family protein [Rhodospirillales bacterium]|nr:patatin-like phospholipase family protein [Rhodospirillales bacterium]
MTKYGFVASGGGYRSFYTAGALVWLRRRGVPITHITSTSSGNNIALDYLLWDHDGEELPPVLGRTMRLGVTDIFQIFSNFLGLRPSLMPRGSHLFTVDKDRCRKSLQLDDPRRRAILAAALSEVKWDILATNLRTGDARYFKVNDILATMTDDRLGTFMDAFLAGITTIPYFKAVSIDGDLHIEGGYLDNTPLATLFQDADVDEIIACDFTDYDFHAELEKLYKSSVFSLPLNSIDTLLLVSDLQLTLPNKRIFAQAALINRMLEVMGKDRIEIDGRTWWRKPIHVLRPQNLEAMTISLKDASAQKRYFERGQIDARTLFAAAVPAGA